MNVLSESINPGVRSRVTFALCDAMERLRVAGNPVTGDALLKLAEPLLREVPGFVSVDKPGGAVNRILVETLATDPAVGPAARRALQRLMAKVPDKVSKRLSGRKGGPVDPVIRKEQRQAFRILVNIFRHETLESPPTLTALNVQVHKITGGQAIELANRMRNALSTPLTDEIIGRWVDAFIAANSGKFPTRYSGLISGTDGQTWGGLNSALQTGVRGRSGNSTLIEWLIGNGYNTRNIGKLPPLDDAQIRKWVDAFIAANDGKLPTQRSGVIPNSGGQTWCGLNTTLTRGARGLPGNSTLADWLVVNGYKESYRHKSNLPPLDNAQIREWVETYRSTNGGKLPTCKSGVIPNSGGQTWGALNTTLTRGFRGLPGGSSLSKWIKANCDPARSAGR